MTNFTCPHCGERTSTERTDVEFVDVGGGSDSLFPSLVPGDERHIDQRLCCKACWNEATPPDPAATHPYDVAHHRDQLARVQREHYERNSRNRR